MLHLHDGFRGQSLPRTKLERNAKQDSYIPYVFDIPRSASSPLLYTSQPPAFCIDISRRCTSPTITSTLCTLYSAFFRNNQSHLCGNSSQVEPDAPPFPYLILLNTIHTPFLLHASDAPPTPSTSSSSPPTPCPSDHRAYNSRTAYRCSRSARDFRTNFTV